MYEGELVSGKPVSLYMKEVSFYKLTKEYGDYSVSRKMSSTYEKDGSVIKALLKEFGALKLIQITTLRIQEAQSKWSKEGKSNKTVNNHSILLGTMLRFAVERQYLANIPKITKLKVDKRRPEWFTEEEIEKILAAAEPFIRDYVIVLLNTGFRASEIKRLKWADVDFKNKVINIEISKSHRFRTIPMNETLFQHMFSLYLRKSDKQVYVFEYNEGMPVSDYYHRFKKLLDRLSIKGHLHKLRHTFASLLVQRGVPIYEVQNLLGHASVQTTQVYAHIRMENLKKAVSVLQVGCTAGAPSEIIDQKVG